MARFDADPLAHARAIQDGPARCRVCATSAPDAEHAWCPAASALVCDECCHGILLAAIGRRIAAEAGGRVDTDSSECASCERGRRWVSSQVLGAMVTGERPN